MTEYTYTKDGRTIMARELCDQLATNGERTSIVFRKWPIILADTIADREGWTKSKAWVPAQ